MTPLPSEFQPIATPPRPPAVASVPKAIALSSVDCAARPIAIPFFPLALTSFVGLPVLSNPAPIAIELSPVALE